MRWKIVMAAVAALLVAGEAQGCAELPAKAQFWVRLTSAVSSFDARAGEEVRAVLLESPRCGGEAVFSRGQVVNGRVEAVRRVGLGLRHETAQLALVFEEIVVSEDVRIKLAAQVMEVDSAREEVKGGVIRGIRSTHSPQGMITNRLRYFQPWNPYASVVMIVHKTAFPIFPEPEIYLPEGTDMRVELRESAELPAELPEPLRLGELDEEQICMLSRIVGEVPDRTKTKKGEDADVVNMVFLSTREVVEEAFLAAGWTHADKVSTGSVLRTFHAILGQTNYRHGPISQQWLGGQPSDQAWQKAFNSYEKRHHLRLWELEEKWEEKSIWAVAAMQETGATLSFRHMRFIHHVSPVLDDERDTVLRDLAAADCVVTATMLPRPWLAHWLKNSEGDKFHTDGNVLVLELKACNATGQAVTAPAPAKPFRPGNRVYRFFRKQILMVRNDVLRANIFYGTYYLARIAWRKGRGQREAPLEEGRERPICTETECVAGGK